MRSPQALAATLLALTLSAGVFGCAGGEGAAPEATEATPPDGVATLGELEVHYEFRPAAESADTAIVLVPGWASTTWAWTPQLDGEAALTELGLPVLAIDLPGHGDSTLPADPENDVTLDLFADSIAAVLDDAGYERAFVLGHSNGAPVALRFYRRHPEKTAALGSVDGALLPMFDLESIESAIAPLRGEDYLDFVRQMIGSMTSPGLREEDRQGLVDMAAGLSRPTLLHTVLATADPAMWSDDEVTVPVLALLARQPSWSAEVEQAVRDQIPELEWIVWEDVGHFIQLERPEALRETVGTFLAERDLISPAMSSDE